MAGDLGSLAGDLRGLAQRLGSSGARRLTTAAATAGKDAALKALKADLPSQRLHNLGRKGTKLSAGYDLLSDTTAEVKMRPRGAWVLLQKGTRPHPIGVGRRTAKGNITGKGKKGIKKRLLIAGSGDGGWVTAPVSHPGAPAKSTLEDAFKGIEESIVPAVAGELAKVIDG